MKDFGVAVHRTFISLLFVSVISVKFTAVEDFIQSKSACDEGSRRESRLAKNLPRAPRNRPVMKASAESLGWRGICQATKNRPVMKAPAESLGWQRICRAPRNRPVMKAPAESLGWRGICRATRNLLVMKVSIESLG